MHMQFFYMMFIIYVNNKQPKGILLISLFGEIINIEPSVYIFIYFLIMRALIDPKKDYCLANMMLIIYTNNK